MPPKKRIKRRGSQEMERMSTQVQARSPDMDKLTCVPETQQSQQAAGVEEVVVGFEDPLQMSDTEQGDISPETQQDFDSSDKDIADTEDTQAAGGTQKGKCKGKGKGTSTTREGQFVFEVKADKRGKKTAVVFSDENEQKLVDFLCDNQILYNKRLKDYKDRSKREAVWDKLCEENNLEKDACQKWFQSLCTLFGKATHMKSVLGGLQLTERRKWTRDNFHFLMDHILHHLKGKSEFRAPKGSASQASAAVGSASRRETVHMEPFQDTYQQ